MGSLGNKAIMSKNLKYYIEKSGKDRRELAEEWGFPYSTVTEWINGRKYPRIDRIEVMADYFGIQKSDLIENKATEEDKKNSDVIADITRALFLDENLLSVVSLLCKSDLDESKLNSVKEYIEFQIKR